MPRHQLLHLSGCDGPCCPQDQEITEKVLLHLSQRWPMGDGKWTMQVCKWSWAISICSHVHRGWHWEGKKRSICSPSQRSCKLWGPSVEPSLGGRTKAPTFGRQEWLIKLHRGHTPHLAFREFQGVQWIGSVSWKSNSQQTGVSQSNQAGSGRNKAASSAKPCSFRESLARLLNCKTSAVGSETLMLQSLTISYQRINFPNQP